jgi:hypothetical protein
MSILSNAITPGMYRRGISKSKHKLSDYVVNTIDEIIIETVDFTLKSKNSDFKKTLIFINTFDKFDDYRINKTIELQSQRLIDSISI